MNIDNLLKLLDEQIHDLEAYPEDTISRHAIADDLRYVVERIKKDGISGVHKIYPIDRSLSK